MSQKSAKVANVGQQRASTPEQEYHIEGAGCASCVSKIEQAISQLPQVQSAHMNFADRSVIVLGDAPSEAVVEAVANAGYRARALKEPDQEQALSTREQADEEYRKRLMRDMAIALGLGVPLMLYGMLGGDMAVHTGAQRAVWLVIGLATLAVMVVSGRHFYVGAWKSLKSHTANMDTLIALGTGTAWLYSMIVVILPNALPELARHVYFEATAMIIGLINLGLALEVRARGKTSQAIKRLMGLQPKTARVIRAEQELDVAVEDVQVGERIRLRPGEKVPVDGVVREGSSNIDESMLTGEPMPSVKKEGDAVVAGTINKSGSLIFEASRVGKDTALAQIIALVKRAQGSKPAIGRLADTIAAYFVPAVMIIAIVSALFWLNFGPEPRLAYAVIAATTVLIIACPCALGLATPMSVMVGVGKAAEAGILIRNGEALQVATNIQTMVLDKTGTITSGMPTVTDVVHTPEFGREQLLLFAASLEAGSEHPLAQAIVDYTREQNLSPTKASQFNALEGLGVIGQVEGKTVLLGNAALMQKHGVSVGELTDQAQDFARQAKTPMYLAAEQQAAGLIVVADPIKTDSVQAIKQLQQQGVRVVMLTGDNAETAKAVATQAGIDDFFAEVMPADKAKKIRELQVKGDTVAMTGDGINDAPALAQADVGFAIGTGTDVAIDSADITLIRGSLLSLSDAIAVSKATMKNIKQNLFGAFIYNVAGIPIAAGLLFPIFGVLLSPVIAGAAMAFSSVTVVSNANRLRFFNLGARG